ncbi:two component transcriptional regulator, LuxR family [Variovorax paradoxus B4]|uniref:Transcriptional regulatory protein DegU n=3 Tax=Variovorax paradoxus TaxID=34073 RepID=A0A0H2MCY0_VARPD|nr:two component transcriptional regulator, LuxR family [Variovorax paradoxus B4]KLN54845.1 transcriptional regulatory protein DegU [Variovorax paradoxus]
MRGGALIVEGSRSVSERMRRILATVAPGLQLAIASTQAEACSMLAAQAFRFVLVGMDGPDGDGAALIRHVRRDLPHIEAIAMSETDDACLVASAIAAGAVGYLLTEADDAELAFLLRAIERGGAPVDPRVARRILGLFAASARPEPIAIQPLPAVENPARGKPLLSPRELKVLRLIAQGWSNRQIAESVSLSVNTVEFHAKNIFRKLCVKSRTQAVHQAMQQGLFN